ncbi:mitotic spindle assembly checkpoint protein MAD2B isoform X2 [Microcebus murinus]|uniref:mitotic spindle assembly checkpoint protein MAD2B isoform X2 n=1 Tax=Microcebus murinus TaxID=30608 RepID=UPI003F6C878C
MTTLTRQDLNFGQVVADVLCEFLEVAVHLILYVREVYPVGIFQKRKKYNVPVQMSCHPELNQYIQDTLHCVKPLLEKNDVEKVVVVILDKEHRPVEKFVFEITQPPLLSIRLPVVSCGAAAPSLHPEDQRVRRCPGPQPPRLYLHSPGTHERSCHSQHGEDPGHQDAALRGRASS